jgi:hypothetical protein
MRKELDEKWQLLRSVSLKMSFPLVGNRRLFKFQRSEPIPDKPE